MSRARWGIALAILAGCGDGEQTQPASNGNASSPPATSGGEQPTAQSGTVVEYRDERSRMLPQDEAAVRARVGHFSVAHGTDGFVLDRLNDPPLFRRDGSSDIVQLTLRQNGDHTELVNQEAGIWLRVEEWGHLLYDGPAQTEGVDVYRDADAQPLTGEGANATTVGALRAGHFVTEDRMEGFVLDQTAEPALFRLDGSNQIVRLTQSEGVYDSVEYRNDQAHVWIRVGQYGEVLYDGPNQTEGVNVMQDARAEPLPRN